MALQSKPEVLVIHAGAMFELQDRFTHRMAASARVTTRKRRIVLSRSINMSGTCNGPKDFFHGISLIKQLPGKGLEFMIGSVLGRAPAQNTLSLTQDERLANIARMAVISRQVLVYVKGLTIQAEVRGSAHHTAKLP